jgi:threonine dehydratase
MSHGSAREGISVSIAKANDRYAWVDVAKGICILLVVLYHVVAFHLLDSFVLPPLIRTAWTAVNMGLVPLRMPLFFIISGLLSARAIALEWKNAVAPRAISLYYLYAIWLLIHFVWFQFAPDVADTHLVLESPQGLISNFLLANTTLWYLYALAAYLVIAKIARGYKWCVLAAAGVINVAVAAEWLPTNGLVHSILENLVFFLIGAYAPAFVLKLADETRRRVRTITSIAIVGGLLVVKRLFDADTFPGLLLVVSVAACIAGIAGTAWAVEARVPGTKLLARIGRATIGIYVLHVLLLSIVQAIVFRGEPVTLPGGTASTIIYPILLTAAIAAASLGTQSLLERARLGVLFRAPYDGFKRLLVRPIAPPTTAPTTES